MFIYWAELWRLSSEFGHTITGNGTSKPIFMFPVPFCGERAFKVALVTFLWRFFIVHFQMCPKNTCLRRSIVTLVTLTAAQFLQRQYRPKIETVAVLQQQFCFLCGKYMRTIYVDNRDSCRTICSAAIPLPARQNTSANSCKELQQRRLLETGL